MRVLVTGGAGFIGSHVVDQLVAGGHVVAILDNFSTGSRSNVNSEARVYEEDILTAEYVLNRFVPSTVIHLAANVSVSKSVRDPEWDLNQNAVATLRLAQSCARLGVPNIIFSSSCVLYGECVEAATPRSPTSAKSPYAISKLAAENYLRYISLHRELNVNVLRFGNVYGPRQTVTGESGVIAMWMDNILEGRPLVTNGDGNHSRDFIYVLDVAKAVANAMEDNWRGFMVSNVGTGVPTTLSSLEKTLRRAAGTELSLASPSVQRDAVPADVVRSLLCPGRYCAPSPILLEEGIRATLQYQQHRNEPRH